MIRDMVLRRYRSEDLDAIFAMDQVCFGEPFRFDLRSMRRFAEARRAISLVTTEAGGRIVGFVIVQVERTPEGRQGYVVTLDVLPAERRGGVAATLMEEVEDLAAHAGARWMGLHVYAGNEGAIRFYEGRGYERVGIGPAFYGKADGAALDALVYRKELLQKVT